VTQEMWCGLHNIDFIEKMKNQHIVKDWKCCEDDFKYCETFQAVKSKR